MLEQDLRALAEWSAVVHGDDAGAAAGAPVIVEEPVEEGMAAWENEMKPTAAKAKATKAKGRTKGRVMAEIVEELE